MNTGGDVPTKVTPIIKVVGDFCNLRCGYCFYSCHDQSAPHRMSDALLEQFLREYLDLFDGNCVFIWHGGEPMLAGLRLFQIAVDLQWRYTHAGHGRMKNIIQTNATLINERWARFFKENNFRIGVSIDGDRQSHDRFRLQRGGKGSFDLVMRGVSHLREQGVPFGVIQTLPRSNLARVEEDFLFFADVLKLNSWGINAFCDFHNTPFAVQESISNREYADYIKHCVDLWLAEDRANLRIREIDSFLAGLFGKRSTSCMFNGACPRYISVDWDGKVYPCGRFSGQEQFCFGDLTEMSLGEILVNEQRVQHTVAVQQLPQACRVCEWQPMCNNGCTYHRVETGGGMYHYCAARREIFSYLSTKVTEYEKIRKGGKTDAWSERDVGSVCTSR